MLPQFVEAVVPAGRLLVQASAVPLDPPSLLRSATRASTSAMWSAQSASAGEVAVSASVAARPATHSTAQAMNQVR
ncbi:hypothetical protein [Streptomyces werraensis]|uniref:hypothetical protein n=1 Tax=Streptomyces werraensis TaxID=68284 RepID=UPI0037D7A7F5